MTSLKPDHLPNASPPKTIPLEMRFQQINLGGHKHAVHSIIGRDEQEMRDPTETCRRGHGAVLRLEEVNLDWKPCRGAGRVEGM